MGKLRRQQTLLHRKRLRNFPLSLSHGQTPAWKAFDTAEKMQMPLSLKAAQSPDCCLPSGKGSAFDSGVFNTDADKGAGSSWKKQSYKNFLPLLPKHFPNPHISTCDSSLQEYSSQLRAESPCSVPTCEQHIFASGRGRGTCNNSHFVCGVWNEIPASAPLQHCPEHRNRGCNSPALAGSGGTWHVGVVAGEHLNSCARC